MKKNTEYRLPSVVPSWMLIVTIFLTGAIISMMQGFGHAFYWAGNFT